MRFFGTAFEVLDRIVVALAMWCVYASAGYCQAPQYRSEMGTIDMVALTPHGARIENVKVLRFINQEGLDFAKFAPSATARVPNGRYSVTLLADGLRTLTDVVVQGDTLAVIVAWGIEPDTDTPQPSTYTLRPTGRHTQAATWARLISLYDNSISRTARFDKNQVSTFYDVSEGDYALLMFNGGDYLGTRILRKQFFKRSMSDITSTR